MTTHSARPNAKEKKPRRRRRSRHVPRRRSKGEEEEADTCQGEEAQDKKKKPTPVKEKKLATSRRRRHCSLAKEVERLPYGGRRACNKRPGQLTFYSNSLFCKTAQTVNDLLINTIKEYVNPVSIYHQRFVSLTTSVFWCTRGIDALRPAPSINNQPSRVCLKLVGPLHGLA
jgi:hypothetical protein